MKKKLWCIRITDENKHILESWRSKQPKIDKGPYTINCFKAITGAFLTENLMWDRTHISYSPDLTDKGEDREITLEEFLKITNGPIEEAKIFEALKLFPESRQALEFIFPHILGKTYKCGDRFKDKETGIEYILAQVGPGLVNFIVLEDGNRWDDTPVGVFNPYKITSYELMTLLGKNNTLFEKI